MSLRERWLATAPLSTGTGAVWGCVMGTDLDALSGVGEDEALEGHRHASQSHPTLWVMKASTSGSISTPLVGSPHRWAATALASASNWFTGQPRFRQWAIWSRSQPGGSGSSFRT